MQIYCLMMRVGRADPIAGAGPVAGGVKVRWLQPLRVYSDSKFFHLHYEKLRLKRVKSAISKPGT